MSVHKKSFFLVTGSLLGLSVIFCSLCPRYFHNHTCSASCTFKVSNTPDVLLHSLFSLERYSGEILLMH